jgi:outer membrane protein TolC
VLKAQVELSKLEDRLIRRRQQRSTMEARMNTLLNRPVEQPFGQTTVLAYTPLKLERSSLKTALKENRPLLRAWRTRIEQSADKIALAHKNYGPDLSVFAAYTQRDVLQNGAGGADFISGGITLSVPLYFWRKQSKQVQENELRKSSVEENYQHVQNQVFFELDRILSDIKKNMQRLDLYKTGIIPQAAQSLNSALIGYQTDKIDFMTLVNNQLTLFNLELAYDKILSSYNKDIAELEYIAGGQLPE